MSNHQHAQAAAGGSTTHPRRADVREAILAAGGSTTRPRRADVREAILAAATEEFTEHGYAATTVDAIAARAGFTKGAAYSNFGGKPELFAAACTAHYDAATAEIGALTALTPRSAGQDALAPHRIAAELTQVVLRGAQWHQTLAEFRALARHDTELAEVYAALLERQRDDLTSRLREAGVPLRAPGPDPYRTAAVVLLATVAQLSLDRAAAPQATPAELISDCLTSLIEGLLA